MRWIGWFQLGVGAAIVLLWPVLIAAGEVPEVAAGQRDIWFHIVAEAIAGLLLISGVWFGVIGLVAIGIVAGRAFASLLAGGGPAVS